MILASFLFFLAVFLAVGIYATARFKNNTDDYLLAGRCVNGWIAGLSANASQQSGFTFIGFIGLTYMVGISGFFLHFGIFTGILMLWPIMSRRIQNLSQDYECKTVSCLISRTHKTKQNLLMIISALFIFVFCSIYAAGQLMAGSKALHVIFEWPTYAGILIGAAILLAYSYAGGIRASIWTDAVQMFVMVASIGFLITVCIMNTGGVWAFIDRLNAIDPGLLKLNPNGWQAFFLFWAGWIFGGFCAFGQPQVVVRYMTVKSPKCLHKLALSYITTGVFFAFICTIAGLCARIYLPELGDAELALPRLAMDFLPAVGTGLILAGLFASTMSTADSLVLSTSAALSQNLVPQWRDDLRKARLATLIVILFSTAVALQSSQSVFDLVLLAWGGLGASLGSVVIARCFDKNLEQTTAIIMMFVAIIVAILWREYANPRAFFEAAPAFMAAGLVYIIARIIRRRA